jgi:DNA-directed RNA polymerase specialized sigma subunit
VGRELGVSQMQVSRLLVQLLANLRESLDPPTAA